MGIFHEMLRRVECFCEKQHHQVSFHLQQVTELMMKQASTDWLVLLCSHLFRSAYRNWYGGGSCKWTKKWLRIYMYVQNLHCWNSSKMPKKSDSPCTIHIQDRGHITFMNPTLVPFITIVAVKVRKLLNCHEYSNYGKDFFKVCLSENLWAALWETCKLLFGNDL